MAQTSVFYQNYSDNPYGNCSTQHQKREKVASTVLLSRFHTEQSADFPVVTSGSLLSDGVLFSLSVLIHYVCSSAEARSPLLKYLQCEVQQLSLALLPPLDHFQDGDCSAEVPA